MTETPSEREGEQASARPTRYGKTALIAALLAWVFPFLIVFPWLAPFAFPLASISWLASLSAAVLTFERERRSRRLAWLSLVLLFVLPAIIAIGVFLKAMEKAKQTSCLSAESELGITIIFYADEHDGRLPNAATWLDDLAKYRGPTGGEGVLCSADQRRTKRTSYAFNAALSGVKLADIKEPDKVVLVFEADIPGDNPSGLLSAAVFRHFGGLNVTFADGHTRRVSREEWQDFITPTSKTGN